MPWLDVCLYVENVRNIYTSNCLQIYEEASEVIYQTDNRHCIGYKSIDILDIYINIWIHILQFRYIYCNLDINMETQYIFL